MPANWHDSVFFGIHYDQHAHAADTVLGAELTYEHLRARLEQVRPDWVQCDCKGHPGYTSWPTRVGSTSPGVVRDALRIYRDVTKDLGIPLGMHYSGVWDDRALELHPALQHFFRFCGICALGWFAGNLADQILAHSLRFLLFCLASIFVTVVYRFFIKVGQDALPD